MGQRNAAARFQQWNSEQVDPHQMPPEHALLYALLGQAIEDATWETSRLAHGDQGTANPTRRQRESAWQWLRDDAIEPWSAAWCAEHVGLALSAVRDAVACARARGQHLRAGHLRPRNQPGKVVRYATNGRPREGAAWGGLVR